MYDKHTTKDMWYTHTYIQTAVNVMFTKIQATKYFNLFVERDVVEMIK